MIFTPTTGMNECSICKEQYVQITDNDHYSGYICPKCKVNHRNKLYPPRRSGFTIVEWEEKDDNIGESEIQKKRT